MVVSDENQQRQQKRQQVQQ